MNRPPPALVMAYRAVRPLAIVAMIVVAGVGVVTVATRLGRQVGSGLGPTDNEVTATVEPGIQVEVEIPPGSTAQDIALQLAEVGVIRSATQFEATVRTSGEANSLRAGRYDLVTGMTPDEVINVLLRGPAAAVYTATIVEGLRVTEILDELVDASGVPREEFEAALLGGEVTTELRTMPSERTLADWEGLLFPDTYEFREGSTAAEVLARLAETMEQRMADINWRPFERAGFTRYEGIIIASLIESEVRVADERAVVSSVIRNRLEVGQRLEIDATILYALGTHDASQIDTGLESPYNTYQVDGLPPTPIEAPGRAALEAAAAPAESGFFFYVLTSPDGSHTFSRTLEEHNAAVAQAREDGVLP